MESNLVEQAIAAQGGLDRWRNASELSVRVSSGGFAFTSKLQGAAVRGVEARVSTREQRVILDPYPQPGRRGVLEPDGTVRIESAEGRTVAARSSAREAFRGLRHLLWWDRLDMLYFACYAIWTYLSVPFVFARDEFATRELERWHENGESWRRLAVTFPPHVHSHCARQVFYFDEACLIRRHDYTAEPIGAWARAAHYCFDHRSFDGLVLPTRRRVYPRRANNLPRSRPLLVWITFDRGHVIS